MVRIDAYLRTYRKLAEKQPDASKPYIAITLNNLALLHYVTHEYKAAEQEYEEALRTYRKLAEAQPKAFLPDLVDTLTGLRILYTNTGKNEEAERIFDELYMLNNQG